MPLPTFLIPVKHRVRRKRHEVVAPPAPAQVQVVRVTVQPGNPNGACWYFDRPVVQMGPTAPGLVMGGHPGQAALHPLPDRVSVDYGVAVTVGQTWSVAAGAGDVKGADGKPLGAGSGTVQAAG